MTLPKARQNELVISLQHQFGDQNTQGFSLDIDLCLPGQGVTAIFGESGSGKSTLLRALAGLLRSERACIWFRGDCWQDEDHFRAPDRRPVGFVFQQPGLFTHLSVRDNLAFAVKRATAEYSADFYQQVLESLDVESLLQRMPHQLSGGESQRVAIARALLRNPALLLMDEPLASLDMPRKREILPYLEQVQRRFNIPVIYVTHSLEEVCRLATHMVLLENGRVRQQGSLSDVMSDITFAIEQGDQASTMLSGKVTARDSDWHLMKVTVNDNTLWLRDDGRDIGTQVRFRVLANDVSIAIHEHIDASPLNHVRAVVEEVKEDKEPALSMIKLKVGAHFLLARITRKSAHHLKLEPGSVVWAQIKTAALL